MRIAARITTCHASECMEKVKGENVKKRVGSGSTEMPSGKKVKAQEPCRVIKTAILDAMPMAVVVIQDRTIRFANQAVLETFGWEPEELIGQEARILYHTKRDYEKISREVAPALEKKRIVKDECPCRRKDGAAMLCQVSFSCLKDAAPDAGLIVTYEDLTEQKAREAALKRHCDKMRRSLEDTIQTIAMIIETREPYKAGHQRGVEELSRAIAEELKLDRGKILGLHAAALIHDIGKIYVPADLLSSPERLSPLEYDIVKRHPQVSYDILKRIDFPWPVATIVYQHHERFDGSGYPRGLKGEEIMIEARILAVADAVESMASQRPYRKTIGMSKAMAEIQKKRGTLYDPIVVDACLAILKKGFKFE